MGIDTRNLKKHAKFLSPKTMSMQNHEELVDCHTKNPLKKGQEMYSLRLKQSIAPRVLEISV